MTQTADTICSLMAGRRQDATRAAALQLHSTLNRIELTLMKRRRFCTADKIAMKISELRVDQKIVGPSGTVYRVRAVGERYISASTEYPCGPGYSTDRVTLDQTALEQFRRYESHSEQ